MWIAAMFCISTFRKASWFCQDSLLMAESYVQGFVQGRINWIIATKDSKQISILGSFFQELIQGSIITFLVTMVSKQIQNLERFFQEYNEGRWDNYSKIRWISDLNPYSNSRSDSWILTRESNLIRPPPSDMHSFPNTVFKRHMHCKTRFWSPPSIQTTSLHQSQS